MLEDNDRDYVFIANPFDQWKMDGIEIPDDVAVFGRELSARLSILKAEVRRSGETGIIETTTESDRLFRFTVEVIPSDGGTWLMTTIVEISEKQRHEEIVQALLREINHRSKNLLAIIQSIVTQTARHSDTMELFLQKFRGRLYSLSMSQDLVTNSRWRGSFFRDLVHEQVKRYLPQLDGAVDVLGDNILLTPNASLHIGLALHELVVNAITHGQLPPNMAIAVSCILRRTDGQVLVEFTWREERARPASDDIAILGQVAPEPHFGSAVLERVLPASVSGQAHYEIGPQHIFYSLIFPIAPETGDGDITH